MRRGGRRLGASGCTEHRGFGPMTCGALGDARTTGHWCGSARSGTGRQRTAGVCLPSGGIVTALEVASGWWQRARAGSGGGRWQLARAGPVAHTGAVVRAQRACYFGSTAAWRHILFLFLCSWNLSSTVQSSSTISCNLTTGLTDDFSFRLVISLLQ